jgi:hypothetical protein
LIALTLVVGASLWSLAIAVNPDDPFATDAGVVISIGLLMFALIAAVGLLMPRGRWARNLSRALLITEAVLATTLPLRGWAIAALVATAAGVVGIQGRWLDGWLRRLPAADGPGLKPMLFLLGALALVPAIGIASPSGLEFRQGLLGAAGIVTAWGYSKANFWALWAGRLGILPLSLLAAWPAAPLGRTFILACGAAMTWLAWAPDTRLAISPLLDQLPGPRRLSPRQETAE